jgi:outer membrane protein assembly factor BamB
MAPAQTGEFLRKPLRLWPGVALAAALLVTRYVLPPLIPDATLFSLPLGMIAVIAGMACALAIAVWWMFFSRAAWAERLGAIILMGVALFATSRLVHESIAGGMQGMMLPMYAIPVATLALVAWAVATQRFPDGPRRALMVVTIVLVCAVFTVIRTEGISGSGGAQLAWRWTETAEDRLLARVGEESATESIAPPVNRPLEPEKSTAAESHEPAAPSTTEHVGHTRSRTAPEWPGFRGTGRNGIVSGVRISTDWSASPPVELWRRPIGPGWSSFAVGNDLLYTQEQRGEDEIVASYSMTTGKPVWWHRDAARFWESNAGAGPRGTPTLGNGRVYALGATGILNVLDARSGSVVWSRNVPADSGVAVPDWGFSSSPLVVDDLVIVAASGKLVAYDAATGSPRWQGPARGGSYSSPQLTTIDGVPQVVLLSYSGATSVAPADGKVLWQHDWPGSTIVQPGVAGDNFLISNGGGMGGYATRRIAVVHGPTGWSAEERWTSNTLKPDFNDFVVHKGHAFGFDGSILACISVEDGKRIWKGGRYGKGQLVLLRDQDLLLVLSEEGELALVRATPDEFKELARFQAISGKTWNHPALIGDVLLVRNGQEMAAFRLSRAER